MSFQRVQQTIQLQQIDWDDSLFRMSRFPEMEGLRRSIAVVGVINPPLLTATDAGKYRIVCGWRRLTILRELDQNDIEAFVAPADIPAIELFDLAFFENLGVRSFNLIEKAEIVAKLQSEFTVPEATIVQRYLPALALADNRRWRRWRQQLLLLPEVVQCAFAQERLSYDLIDPFAALPDEERLVLLDWIDTLHLGKNRQKELLLLLNDLQRRDQQSLSELLAQPDLQELLQADQLTPSQKTVRLFDWLKSQRWPNFSRMENRFQELVHSFRFPANMQLQHSPYFESEWFDLQFRFRNQNEFAAATEVLQNLSASGAVQSLKELTEG